MLNSLPKDVLLVTLEFIDLPTRLGYRVVNKEWNSYVLDPYLCTIIDLSKLSPTFCPSITHHRLYNGLSMFPNVKSLNISGTTIIDKFIPDGCQELQTLIIHNCLNLKEIGNLPKLKKIVCNQDHHGELVKTLKNVEIEYVKTENYFMFKTLTGSVVFADGAIIPEATVLELKELFHKLVESKPGTEPGFSRMIFAGKRLEDHRKIVDYGFPPSGGVIHVVLRLRGGSLISEDSDSSYHFQSNSQPNSYQG
jgi:hypothetical protein